MLSLQEDVGVRVDETGHNGLVGEIDNIGAGGNLRSSRIRDAFDTIAANDNDLVATRRIGLAVDQSPGTNYGEGMQCWRAFLSVARERSRGEKHEDPPRVSHV